MSDVQVIALVKRFVNGDITIGEEQELFGWLEESDDNVVREVLAQVYEDYEPTAEVKQQSAATLDRVQQKINEKINEVPVVPVHRVHLLRTAWFRYAAAIMILLSIGTYLFVTNNKEKPSVTQTNPHPVNNDILPGGNRAILTLADGKEIMLDNSAIGKIADQGNAIVVKNTQGKIEYKGTGQKAGTVMYNTMTTPRGGQYELSLPDGSQVWLNAESSITYPTAFNTSERRVTITGEAYFEVAKDKAKPFKVSVKGKQEVEVLGTHFNINAYKEEPTINTTLLEGSVRLSSTSVHTSLILKPGQQGQLNQQQLSRAANPDVDQVMAWKNGLFNFNKMSLSEVLRQLARWYDVDIEYQGSVAPKEFSGEIQRDLNLSEVLEGLKETGVHFRIEGKKLIVLP